MQSNNGHKRAVLYARVSTDEQKDKGYSLPSQFDAMRKYAAQEGLTIVGEFQDDYSGATPIEFRPEGAKAYTMLKAGGADAIIAYRIDRYVRPPEDGDEWDLPVLIRGLAKLGKEIHVCNRGKLKTDFADLLIAMLDARKAGEERRDIRERVMRGKRRKVKEGKVIGIRAPYGYRLVRDEHGKVITLEIDETTGRIVQIIYRWYVLGDESGRRLSSRAITRRLSEMGASTPGERQKGYTRKRGKAMWNHEMVRHILSNELYAGIWHYGIRTTEQTKREDWESVSANIPAIVDRETWERAQAQRAKNQALAKRNAKREYLLSGRIRCGLCNSAYYGTFLRGVLYYRDSWEKTHHQGLEGGCVNKSIRAGAIEADIWDEIRELFSDLDRLWADLKAAQQNEDDQLKPLRDKLQITDDLIRHEEHEAAKIAAALPDTEKGSTARKLLIERDRDISARLADLAKQREKIIAELGARKLTDDAIETIMQFARNAREGIENATFEDKRRLLEILDVQVTVTPGKYHLKCVIGEKDGEISQIGRDGMRIVANSP